MPDTVSDYDEFSTAFEAIGHEDPVAEGETLAEDPPVEPEAPVESADVEAVDDAEPEEAAEDAEVEATAEEVDWQAKYNELQDAVARQAATQPQYESPGQKAKRAMEAGTPPPPPSLPDLYSEEEKAFLESYNSDWEDVVRGEALRRRAEYRELVGHVFAEVNRVYGPIAQQFTHVSSLVGDREQLSALRNAHPDYDTIHEDVRRWVTTLPGYIRGRAQEVVEAGTASEVIELIQDYKRATGRGSAPESLPSGVSRISSAARKAAKGLGAVDHKRTTAATASVDKDDFDSAWAEATR
jgi:hypothetical protein